jgi:hypothetical protein
VWGDISSHPLLPSTMTPRTYSVSLPVWLIFSVCVCLTGWLTVCLSTCLTSFSSHFITYNNLVFSFLAVLLSLSSPSFPSLLLSPLLLSSLFSLLHTYALVYTYSIDNSNLTTNFRVFNRFRIDIPCDLVFPLSRHSNLKLTEQNVVSLSNNGCAGKYARVRL